MIEIRDLEMAGEGWTFDLTVNGSTVEGCRGATVWGRLQAILPQSAALLDWGDESLATVTEALRKKADHRLGWSVV
ncbi:MAG TPA: hypothetical protein VGO22_05710 [Pseudorhizobium sp.]|jgi:hypothetical protein|nr:hypothetical protein [Pseudorhizobium sp.]